MGMTLKELLTKGEGTLSAQEAKTLAAQCRMDVETLYTLLEERGIKIIEDEADADVNLDVDSIIAEVENAENNSDELSLGGDDEEEAAEENPADLKAAMDELLDDPVKNYLKQIGQIPLLSAEQEVDLSKRIHAGAEAAHILQADRQKYSAPEYIKRTAPASRSRKTRTAAATPRTSTKRAARSQARTPRKRPLRKRPWRLWRTAP